MKEQLPPPEFDAGQYDRPNQNWICGKAADGQCCHAGPDPRGRCQARYECRPLLELKQFETKGHYRCTRTPEFGGPCESGPLPNGKCCRPIVKCQPVRSLRARRKVFTMAVVIFTVAALLVALCGRSRARLITPGKLSVEHSTAAFARLHGGGLDGDAGCAACHAAAAGGPLRWTAAAVGAATGPLAFGRLLDPPNTGLTAIDEACQHCHQHHNFHQPNVTQDHSCSACHREHLGGGPIRPPTDQNCAACHADAHVMAAAFRKGQSLPPAEFDYRADNQLTLFKAPRSALGHSRVIHAFATDHPEFQVLREKLPDPDTLKFNHQLHLSGPGIPLVNGKKLECASCHKPDATGLYYQPVAYKQHCQSCHSLQFDAGNPGLALPHGNPQFTRAFLRSLPAQYAEFARTRKGLTVQGDVDDFVQHQLTLLGGRVTSIDELESKVFFSNARSAPPERIAGQERPAPASFPGCAYCHEVKPGAAGSLPVITRPVQINRWLIRGSFDHAKHLNLTCAKCHDAATGSRETADVLLPSRAVCVQCHSPQGGVANNCSACHAYHARPALARN